MKNWSPNSLQTLTDCPWEEDLRDAENVCQQLKIPFRSINFEKEYKKEVINYFLAEYRAGRTPNPDIICNKAIKFGAFYSWAKEAGADLVASGHYARIIEVEGQPRVARGQDSEKDQSYFIWTLTPKILTHTLFPIGELKKSQVRQIAQENQLAVADKKDSQGICFIGHINVANFLQAELGVKEGLVKTPQGTVVGQHHGAHILTIGQRHGFTITNPQALAKDLNLRPTNLPPLFVVAKDVAKNEIVVGTAEEANLSRTEFSVHKVIWHTKLSANQPLQVQIRYRGEVVDCQVKKNGAEYLVTLEKKLKAVASGQFAVFYSKQGNDSYIVGGGTII